MAVEHQVHALAGYYQRSGLRIVEAIDVIYKYPGGIDYRSGSDLISFATFQIGGRNPTDHSLLIFQQAGYAGIVEHIAAVVGDGLCQVNGQAGVIKLAVMVDHPAPQAFFLQVGYLLHGGFFVYVYRGAQPQLAGHHIIDFKAHRIKRATPPFIVGYQKLLVFHQMGGVVHQQAAFLQGFQYQGDIALRQVAHPAMHQLGAA